MKTKDTSVWIHFDHMQSKLNVKEKIHEKQNDQVRDTTALEKKLREVES